jgi:hypothetical protein
MSTHLRPVDHRSDTHDDDTEDYYPTPAVPRLRTPFPPFEGNPVESARVRLSGTTGLDVGDEASGIDDVVKLYVEGRVTDVAHKVDKVTGQLVRVHTVAVIEATQLGGDFDIDRAMS